MKTEVSERIRDRIDPERRARIEKALEPVVTLDREIDFTWDEFLYAASHIAELQDASREDYKLASRPKPLIP